MERRCACYKEKKVVVALIEANKEERVRSGDSEIVMVTEQWLLENLGGEMFPYANCEQIQTGNN